MAPQWFTGVGHSGCAPSSVTSQAFKDALLVSHFYVREGFFPDHSTSSPWNIGGFGRLLSGCRHKLPPLRASTTATFHHCDLPPLEPPTTTTSHRTPSLSWGFFPCFYIFPPSHSTATYLSTSPIQFYPVQYGGSSDWCVARWLLVASSFHSPKPFTNSLMTMHSLTLLPINYIFQFSSGGLNLIKGSPILLHQSRVITSPTADTRRVSRQPLTNRGS